MKEAVIEELLKLSPAERIQLAEDLWDSVAAQPESLPALSDDQRREIERRVAEHTRDPSSALTWEEVRARLWSRLAGCGKTPCSPFDKLRANGGSAEN